MTLSRARDVYYAVFIASFIPTIVFFDCLHLWPSVLVPPSSYLWTLQDFYKTTFNDPLTIAPPPWFRFYKLVEACYELPVAVWAVWELSRRKKCREGVYAHLCVWGVVGAGTTATCVWEYLVCEALTAREMAVLVAMYGAYGLIFAGIAIDMFCRIQGAVNAAAKVETAKKRT